MWLFLDLCVFCALAAEKFGLAKNVQEKKAERHSEKQITVCSSSRDVKSETTEQRQRRLLFSHRTTGIGTTAIGSSTPPPPLQQKLGVPAQAPLGTEQASDCKFCVWVENIKASFLDTTSSAKRTRTRRGADAAVTSALACW